MKFRILKSFFSKLLVLLVLSGEFCCAKKSADIRLLEFTLDDLHPYLIVYTEAAGRDYWQALQIASVIHPRAELAEIDLSCPEELFQLIQCKKPYYLLIFIRPEELDLQTAYLLLNVFSSQDEDPFVDLRWGFVCGESAEAVKDFMQRTKDLVTGKLSTPAAFVDLLGPSDQVPKDAFYKTEGSFMLPALGELIPTTYITHGVEGFSRSRLESLAGAGLIHFGGHGYPDRIVSCLNGPFVRRVPFAPAVIFSGACYTGVVGKWYEPYGKSYRQKKVAPELSFALGVLANNALAYFAALHADHGIPVYQEIEYLLSSGSSLGDVIKNTYDGIVLGSGGKPFFKQLKLPAYPPLTDPTTIMLWGTASRVLFGDPALKITNLRTEPPFEIEVVEVGYQQKKIKIRGQNSKMKTSFADTYYADLSRTSQFNGRLLLKIDWKKQRAPSKVLVYKVTHNGKQIPFRLIGWAIEEDGQDSFFHLQIDFEATSYLQTVVSSGKTEIFLDFTN